MPYYNNHNQFNRFKRDITILPFILLIGGLMLLIKYWEEVKQWFQALIE